MKKRTLKRLGLIFLAGLVIAGAVAAYLFFKPHRNVQQTNAYATVQVKELTGEFEKDAASANIKYLASDGNSKVLIVEGRVNKISTNQNNEQVIVLKDEAAKVGVSGTFTKETSAHLGTIKVGDIIKIKGAITAGNRYDPDLDLYEHAVLVQCDVVK
jgi:hypothetical protein